MARGLHRPQRLQNRLRLQTIFMSWFNLIVWFSL